MQKIKTYLITPTLIAISIISAAIPMAVDAAGSCTDSSGTTIQTSVLDCPSGKAGRGIIWDLLIYAVNFLAAGVGIAVVAGIVFGAITYATAADKAEQAKKGVSFIINSVVGLLLFIFMYAIINFLVPGGLL